MTARINGIDAERSHSLLTGSSRCPELLFPLFSSVYRESRKDATESSFGKFSSSFNALHLSKVIFNKWICLCVVSQSWVLVAGRPHFCAGCSAISAINVRVISVYLRYFHYFIGPWNHENLKGFASAVLSLSAVDVVHLKLIYKPFCYYTAALLCQCVIVNKQM